MYKKKDLIEIEHLKESWESSTLKKEQMKKGERKKKFITSSGIPIKSVYTPLDLSMQSWNYIDKLGFPGDYPFTRGPNATMYRGEFARQFQYGGFATAKETNKRLKWLLEEGVKDLCVALDLPTQIGYDSDNPLCVGEVGKIGVAIDSLADWEDAFDDVSLKDVWLGTVGSAIGPIFLAWIVAGSEKNGMPLGVAIQGDILREYVARGTYIFPIRPSVKFTCDYVEYCINNGIMSEQAYCGYHMKEAGATAVQEAAFTLANAAEYIRELIRRGISVDELNRPRVLFSCGMDFFEEICAKRAFRRMWAKMMKEKFHAKKPQSMVFTFQMGNHKSSLTAQQPLNNAIRSTIMTLAQTLAGAQVASASQFTEALSLPTPEAVLLSLRTQQIIEQETGVTDVVDPLAGSYYVESLTDEIEEKATDLFEKIEAMGGAMVAIEQGFMQKEIAQSAYRKLKEMESGERVRVGVNKYQMNEKLSIQLQKIDPQYEKEQIKRLHQLKRRRDDKRVKMSLKQLKDAAKAGENLVPPILIAVKSYATVGEICNVLRVVYGESQRAVAGI